MEILALILIITATLVWVILPLGRPAEEEPSETTGRLGELEERRRQLLFALQDLDFELQTGKLSAEDHGSLRDRLQMEAVEVLRRIEQARADSA